MTCKSLCLTSSWKIYFLTSFVTLSCLTFDHKDMNGHGDIFRCNSRIDSESANFTLQCKQLKQNHIKA